MKFTKKIGVIVAGAALLGTSMASLPINATNYVKAANEQKETNAAAVVGSYKISGLTQPGEIQVGKTFKLPKVTFTNISDNQTATGTVETVLVSPSNNNVKLEADQTEVTLDERGTYLLYYVLKDGDNELAKSETVEIKVVGSSYEFEFPANQYFDYKESETSEVERLYTFLPSETAPNKDFKFTLPIPNVLLSKTGKQQEVRASVKVTNSNGDTILSYAGGAESVSIPNEAYKPYITEREVTAYDKDGNALAEKVKAITIEAKPEDVNDVYKVTYSYDDSDLSSKIESVYDVSILDADSFKADRELTATFEGTGAPTSAVLGKAVTMPAPKVTNKNDSSDEVVFRTKMEVCFVDKNGVEWSLSETPEQNKRTDISANFTFTPNQNGLYRIYYKAFDAYGKSTRENCYIIKNVTDSEAPVVKFVKDYKVDKDGKLVTDPEKIEDGAYLLPTVVSASTKTIDNYGGTVDADTKEVTGGESKTFYGGVIYIPAVYGTDNATKFEKLKLNRTVRIKNGYFADGNKTFTVEDEWKRQNPGVDYPGDNTGVYIYLEKEGDYTVEFSATDATPRTAVSSYDVTTKGSNVDKELPKINDLKVGYTYQQNSEVKFAVPTATDDIDTRLNVEVGYFFETNENKFNNMFTSGKMTYDDTFKANLKKLTTPSHRSIDARDGAADDLDNYYIETSTNEGTLYIVTTVMDYANRNKTSGQEIKVLVTKVNPAKITDNAPVKYKSYGSTEAEPGSKNGYFIDGAFTNVYQGFEVKLPSVDFIDVEDSRFSVSVYVSYVNDEGKLTGRTYTGATIVSVPNYTDDNDAKYKICRTVYGGSFIPAKAGTYVVTYTAKDAGGHLETVSFPMSAIQTEKPSIIPQGYDATMELGDTQTFYQAVIMNNGERVNNPEDVELEMVDYGADREDGVNITNDGFDPVNKTFTPTMPGEYHFRFKYSVKPLNAPDGEPPLEGVSDIIKIKVQDTTKPEITLNKNLGTDVVKFVSEGQTTYAKLTPKAEGYEDIKIPNFTANDKFYGPQYITYSYSVKKDGTTIMTEGEAGKGGYLTFTPGKSETDANVNANGTYTITYTAKDINGNTATQTYNLAVGDIEAPKIEFKGSDSEKKQNQPSGEIKLSKKGNYVLEIKASKDYISATDNSGKFSSANANDDGTFKEVTVTLTGPDGTVKGTYNNGIYTYNLTTAGRYTLTYRVTDEAGNPTSVPYTFTLVKNDSKTSTATIVWSVILSVLALAGLGVALYFLLRDKNNKKGKKEKKSVTKEKQDDDKIVV